MMTPAQRHFLKKSAEHLALQENPTQQVSNKYQLMLAKLATDKRRLKEVKSLERRTEIKKEILPDYYDWLDGALASEQGNQDDVVVTILVWLLDVGDFERALAVGQYAIRSQMTMPDQFERDIQTVIVDEISDAALKAQKNNQSFSLDCLYQAEAIADGHDMADPAKAKLYKAIAVEEHAKGALEEALRHYRLAESLNERVGVKKLIQAIEKELAK
ncbi:phage terminase small subunit [Pelistega sp. MC2]|uniref:phage terminase small subunit n=1 Tax=Pelistega sp. MC2 TaxID=1720297 RepID=UPI0008DB262E|nr:phage terminase small subunit [Pelistega sp. MC2]